MFRGRIDQELDAREFYQAIGRDDLGHAYQRRRALMIGSFFASQLAFIALVDLATQRVAASIEVAALPADRDAAVSAITQVVAQLAAQVVDHTDRAPGLRPPALPGPTEAQISRARRALAELKFNRRSIRLAPSDRDERSGSTAWLPDWLFLRGELDQMLEPPAFYRLVGRDDLAWAYRRRHGLAEDRRLHPGRYVAGGGERAARLE